MTASKLRLLGLAVGTLLAGAVAQAQQAPAPGAKPATAARSSAAPVALSPKAAAGGKVSGSQVVKAAPAQRHADPSAQLIKDARDAGFKPTHIRGALMFCRTAIELGSNFPVRTCYNEQQVGVKVQEYEAQRAQLRSGHFLPAGMPQGCNSLTCQ